MPAEPLDVAVDASAEAVTPVGTRRVCLADLGGRAVAVEVHEAREVVIVDTWSRVPGAPSSVLGVANLRGTILPVIEARPLLGLPSRPLVPGTPALLLAAGASRAAMVIDRVLGLEVLPETDTGSTEPVTGTAGFLRHGDDRVMLLDARAILDAVRAAWAAPAQGG